MPRTRWSCPNCGVVVDAPYCPQCGERRLEQRDLTMRGLLDRVVHALTDIDGRVLRTLWKLTRRPGDLTVAYLTGLRKPFLGPLQIFLFANVLFFAIQSFSASSVLGAKLESHLRQQDWRETANALVEARLAREGTVLADYAPIFDRAVERHAKSLVFVMAIPYALLLAILFRRRAHPFVTHTVVALHAWAFLLIVFSFALLLADADLLAGGPGLGSARMDNILTTICGLACAMHTWLAIGPVYGIRGWRRFACSVLLTLAVGAIVLGYRFGLFLLTLYTTT